MFPRLISRSGVERPTPARVPHTIVDGVTAVVPQTIVEPSVVPMRPVPQTIVWLHVEGSLHTTSVPHTMVAFVPQTMVVSVPQTIVVFVPQTLVVFVAHTIVGA